MQTLSTYKKWLFFFVIILIVLSIATPVLADYLGPNRTVTQSISKCKVVLNKCEYVEAKDDYRYHQEEDWSCSNESEPWQSYPNNSRPCSKNTNVGYEYWKREDSTQEEIVTYPPATISGSLLNCTLQNGWCATSPQLSLNANEPVAGYSILAIEGTLNAETFACSGGAASCNVSLNEGDNNFTYWALSSWGDSSTIGTSTARVDTVSPSLSLDISGTNGTNGWYISPTTITAIGSDATSGLTSALLSINSGVWQPSTTLNEGIYNVVVTASDNAGNTSNASTTLSIDTTTPSINISFTGTAGNNGWYRSGIQVSALASDATSGVGTFEVSTDSSGYQSYTAPISFNDGHHTIQFKAKDNAGNITETPMQEFYVDTVAPSIDLPGEWELGRDVPYNVQDDGSGLESLRLVIEDEDERYSKVAWNQTVSGSSFSKDIDWDGIFKDGTVAPPGTYLVWIKARDKAGNERIKLGKVIVPEPNALISLFQSKDSPAETPIPPEYLSQAEDSSITTPPNLDYGGSAAEATETTTHSLFLTTGTVGTSSESSSNVLWGAAAAAMIGAATTYALTERRKREEALAEQAAQEARQEERRAKSQAQKMEKLEAQWAQERRWEEARQEQQEQIETARKQGEDRRTQQKEVLLEVEEKSYSAKPSEWKSSYDAYVTQRAEKEKKEEDLQAGLAAYYAAMQEDSTTKTKWWENTKSFVKNKIIEPVNTYVYQPYVKPAMEKTTEAVINDISWINKNVYQPYIEPAMERTKQFLVNEVTWVNENIYQPYVKPGIENNKQFLKNEFAWINENIYQPYIGPAIEKNKQFIKNEFEWINENIYQPYMKPYIDPAVERTKQFVTSEFAWINENLYQPYIKPVVEETKQLLTKEIDWLNESIYQPLIEPVVSDLDKYIYQPYLKPSIDEATIWWENTWDKYGEWVHNALDAAGVIPGLGDAADGINALIYLTEGRYLEAGISALAMIPILGDFGKVGKLGIEVGEELVEETIEKAAMETAEELLEKTAVEKAAKEISEESVKVLSQRVTEEVLEETSEEFIEKTTKESLEEGIEKTAEEAGEELTSKVAKASIEEVAEKTVKEIGEELVEDVSQVAAEKTTKAATEEVTTKVFKNAEITPANALESVSKPIKEEVAEATVEQVSRDTAQFISSLNEKYGEETVTKFLSFCKKYNIDPYEVLTRPPAEGQSLIGWGLGIADPTNPVNHPLMHLNLTEDEMNNILTKSIKRSDSKVVVLGYGGGAAKPYYLLSDEIGGCHLSLSAEDWAPFENAKSGFWVYINAPFIEKAIEERKIFLFNVDYDVVIDPANARRFSLPELRLIELEKSNYIRVPIADYTAYVPIELSDTYEQYLHPSLTGLGE